MASWRDAALVTGVALEVVAAIAARDGRVAIALVAHLGSCSGIAVGVGRAPGRAAVGRLAFAMALFVPILGALGWIAAAFVAPAHDDRPGPAVVCTPIPGPGAARIRAGRLPPPPGAGPASARVAAARRRDDPGAIALLRRSLADPDEDVRLVAHAVLESRHRIADRALHDGACELARAPAERFAVIHGRLAAAHWELAWTGLAEGDCLVHALECARQHAQAALADHATPALLLLLARIELRCGSGADAEAALVRALELGLAPAIAAPYLAEAAFLERRFDHLRQRLAAAPAGSAAVDRIPELLVMSWDFDRAARAPADVALLVEGTYPFVRGGVASWVHRLIESLPDIAFSVVFLGARRSDHGPPAFPAPPNVRNLERRYLFEAPEPTPAASIARGRCPMAELDGLHELLRTTSPDAPLDPVLLASVARRLTEPGGVTRARFLHGDDAWQRIDDAYGRDCPEASFTDYFWTIRATHAALFTVAELARQLPPARSYHAVSTGYAGLLGALLHHRHGRPLVVTEHGLYTKERKIELASAEHVPGDGDPGAPGFGRGLWIRLFQGLARIAYASAARTIALHEASRRRQIQDGADPVRTRVIPNGVELARFARVRTARANTPPPVLGFLGRLVPIKDVKCFVRAMKAVVSRFPEAQGWIVGPTSEDESYARECAQLAHALGLEGRLTFTGYRPAEEVLPRLGVLVLTSISEGLPLVVLEAFASGLPVVTTDVGACRELVEGRTPEDRALGAAGAVVPIADPEAVARAALAVLRDPARWRAARDAGLRRVETYYSEARVFEAYRQIYREVGTWRA